MIREVRSIIDDIATNSFQRECLLDEYQHQCLECKLEDLGEDGKMGTDEVPNYW